MRLASSFRNRFGDTHISRGLAFQIVCFVVLWILLDLCGSLIHTWAFHEGWAKTSGKVSADELTGSALAGTVSGTVNFFLQRSRRAEEQERLARKLRHEDRTMI